jgi:hypothetical protein
MKSFQAIIIAAILAAASAANEPVASPAAANVERELAEYEKRHLQEQGTPATSAPTPVRSPTRPTPGVSTSSMISHILLQLRSSSAITAVSRRRVASCCAQNVLTCCVRPIADILYSPPLSFCFYISLCRISSTIVYELLLLRRQGRKERFWR